jgi:hypothetical protein
MEIYTYSVDAWENNLSEEDGFCRTQAGLTQKIF